LESLHGWDTSSYRHHAWISLGLSYDVVVHQTRADGLLTMETDGFSSKKNADRWHLQLDPHPTQQDMHWKADVRDHGRAIIEMEFKIKAQVSQTNK